MAKTMNEAGVDVVPVEMDLSSRSFIQNFIAGGQKYGPFQMLVNAAGVSPSQAPIEAILKGNLYGTAVLLEEVGKVIAPGGVGVTFSNQSGWRMPALTAQQDFLLATTPTEELLMSDKGAFISGATLLVDGGATASYFYGPLQPGTEE